MQECSLCYIIRLRLHHWHDTAMCEQIDSWLLLRAPCENKKYGSIITEEEFNRRCLRENLKASISMVWFLQGISFII